MSDHKYYSNSSTQKGEDKYLHLYNSMNQGVVYQNADGYITDANPAAQRLLGLSLAQLQGRKSVDPRWKAIRQDGSDFPGEEHPAMLSLKSGKPIRDAVMGIYHHKKDSYVWILVNAEPIYGDKSSDEPSEVYTTFTDITERIFAEKRLEHQSELQAILTAISGSFINISGLSPDEIIDDSLMKLGKYLDADRTYIFDYEHEQENIRNTYEWCKEGIEPQLDQLQETPYSMVPDWIDAHHNGKTMNIPDVMKLDKEDGLRQILEPQGIKSIITVPIIDKENCIGFVGIDSVADHKIFGDIDENILKIYSQLLVNLYKKIEAQKEIEEKQSFMDGVFQSSNSLVAIKSIEGKYLFVNRQWEKVTGLKSEDIIGRTDFDFFPPEIARQFVDNDRQVIEKDRIIETEEILAVEMSETYRYFLSNKFPIKYNSGKTKGLCFIAFEITDRKKVEKELEETNIRLQNLVNSQTNYVVRVNLEGFITYANPKYIEDFGWFHKGREVIGTPALDSIQSYHRQKTREIVELCINNPGTIEKVELDKALENGSIQTTLWEIVCLTDKDGNPTEVQSLGFDITKEKKVTEKLIESENKYKTLFEDSPEGYLIQKDNIFIECNAAAINIIGYDNKEQLIGKSPADISPSIQLGGMPSNQFAEKLTESAHQDGNVRFEWLIKRGDNSTVLLNVSLSKIIYNDDEVLFVSWHDITKERENEDRINLLSEVIEQSPMLVVITNTKGEIEYVNSSLVNKIGYSKKELIGSRTDIWRSGYHNEAFYNELWDTIKSGEKWRGEFYNKTKAGEYYWEKAVVSPIFDKYGSIKHFAGVKEDVTIIKQVEAERITQKEVIAANEAKGKFLSRMSHEIRTPLNAIMSYSYILQRNNTFTNKQNNQLHAINRSGEHLLKLIEDILDYSKIESNRIEIKKHEFSTKLLCDDMELMFHQNTVDKGIYFKTELNNIPEYIFADEGKIRQVLVNIIGNSVKFTDFGGITLKTNFTPSLLQDEGQLQISISDTGPGMTKEEVDDIFIEFAQFGAADNKGGTGLGMPIVRKLIDVMGGNIKIDSKPGKGTKIDLSIPVVIVDEETISKNLETRQPRIPDSGPVSSRIGKIKVLIVDDSEDNRDTLRELIEPDGYDIYEAVDGKDGVKKAKNIKPDIILMDIQMPKMNGYEASKQIKSEPFGDSVKIIAVTASEYERDDQKLIDNGLDDYLRKPFQPEILFEKIKYWISQLD